MRGGGGSTAAPVARKIMDYALLHLSEPQDMQKVVPKSPLAIENVEAPSE